MGVIFEHKGKNHLIKKDIRCKDDVFTHLYTLVLNPDQSYEVLIDNEKAESGTLTDDWDFLPPKMIKDPNEKKPSDWVDAAKMDDPEDSKPEDWDKPEHMADPDATKPEDWDDDGWGVGAAHDRQSRVQGRVEAPPDRQPGLQGRLGSPRDRQPRIQRGRCPDHRQVRRELQDRVRPVAGQVWHNLRQSSHHR